MRTNALVAVVVGIAGIAAGVLLLAPPDLPADGGDGPAPEPGDHFVVGESPEGYLLVYGYLVADTRPENFSLRRSADRVPASADTVLHLETIHDLPEIERRNPDYGILPVTLELPDDLFGVYVPEGSTIQQPADLRGRTIYLRPSVGPHRQAMTILALERRHGIDPGEVGVTLLTENFTGTRGPAALRYGYPAAGAGLEAVIHPPAALREEYGSVPQYLFVVENASDADEAMKMVRELNGTVPAAMASWRNASEDYPRQFGTNRTEIFRRLASPERNYIRPLTGEDRRFLADYLAFLRDGGETDVAVDLESRIVRP